MSTARRSILPIILALMVNAPWDGQIRSQTAISVEEAFLRGLAHFDEGRYTAALLVFDSLTALKPPHERTTAALVMAGKSRFRLHDYEGSVALLADFTDRYPGSSYRDDAWYTIGESQFMLHQYPAAAASLLRALENSPDTLVAERAEQLFRSIVRNRLVRSDLDRLLTLARHPAAHELVSVNLAGKLIDEGNFKAAGHLLAGLTQPGISGNLSAEIVALRRRIEEGRQVKIGVLLPLPRDAAPGPAEAFGEEILEGISYALELTQSDQGTSRNIALDIRDTELDSVRVRSRIIELARDSNVVAIIGPLSSALAAAAAPVANALGIPLITPTASAVGIAAAGMYVFQLNPDLTMRGRAMARAAVSFLGFTNIGVLSSEESVAASQAEAFMREVERLGGTIRASESYKKGMSDLSEQFLNLRKLGGSHDPQLIIPRMLDSAAVRRLLDAGADAHIIDSLRITGGTIGARILFGGRGEIVADSLGLRIVQGSADGDELEIPMTELEGIFLAVGSPEEIGFVSSQKSYFNIRAQMLGSSEWYDAEQLEAHRRYLDGVMFVSDSFVDMTDPQYRKWHDDFLLKRRREPSRQVLLGYDTMNLILNRLLAGVRERDRLARDLATIRKFPGLRSPITLTNGRVNSEFYLLQYEDGNVRRIGTITVE